MKNLVLLFALVLTAGNSFADTVTFPELMSGTTSSTFVSVTKLLESGTLTTLSPLATTKAALQQRGVAGKEQLKDDLVAFNEDMVAGKVKEIEDVRQPALKELFEEIASDENNMGEINSVVSEGSELHKIATAVTVALMME